MISAILPVHNESESLMEVFASLSEVMQAMSENYEILFVDDGSTDRSAATLREIESMDTHVRVIRFDRNYGQSNAIQAGFDHAAGSILVTLDADLENAPVDIPPLIEKLRTGYDVVCGRRDDRPKNFKARCSGCGNALFRILFGSPVQDMACTLRAYRKEVIDDFAIRASMHRYLPVLLHMKGASVMEMHVGFKPRKNGSSKYGVLNRIPSIVKDTLLLIFFRKRVLQNKVRRYRIEGTQ